MLTGATGLDGGKSEKPLDLVVYASVVLEKTTADTEVVEVHTGGSLGPLSDPPPTTFPTPVCRPSPNRWTTKTGAYRGTPSPTCTVPPETDDRPGRGRGTTRR